LVALQKRTATALADPGDCRPRELAELVWQLRKIAREIEDIDGPRPSRWAAHCLEVLVLRAV
jgi:hypothetical protein